MASGRSGIGKGKKCREIGWGGEETRRVGSPKEESRRTENGKLSGRSELLREEAAEVKAAKGDGEGGKPGETL